MMKNTFILLAALLFAVNVQADNRLLTKLPIQVAPIEAKTLNPQAVEAVTNPVLNSPAIAPETSLPAPANNMSGQLNGAGAPIKSLNTGVQLKTMQAVSFEETANKQKCGDKRCILDINGLPLSQVVITATKPPKRYKINGWGFAGKVMLAKLTVNNSQTINLNVISNSSTQVELELPSDIGGAQKGSAQLLILMGAEAYAVYAKELIKFEVPAVADNGRINTAEIGSSNVQIAQKIEAKSLSACKNCIESVDNKLSNIVYEVGGQTLTIKGDGFGDKTGKVLLHLNGQPGNKVIPLELMGRTWTDSSIIVRVPYDTTGVLDDNNAVLELIKSDGSSLAGASNSKVKAGKFIAAREITTLTTLDIPRKIQQEGIAPTNMKGDFYHQELNCKYQENRCEALKHGFTDVFTLDTKEGFEVLKDQTVVEFDYTANGMTFPNSPTFPSNAKSEVNGWQIYFYPQNQDYGALGSHDWQGDRLMVNRYMKQYRAARTLGTGGDSIYASGAKVTVKIRGPKGVSPLHISQNASKK